MPTRAMTTRGGQHARLRRKTGTPKCAAHVDRQLQEAMLVPLRAPHSQGEPPGPSHGVLPELVTVVLGPVLRPVLPTVHLACHAH